MKLVTLVENTACRHDLAAEHGLSLYLETGNHKILFDAGQSGAFAENAEKLGIDLAEVDLAVLSHGHYDHGGGLPAFLKINPNAKIYVNRYAFEGHFNAAGKDIGLTCELQKNNRLVFTDGKYPLAEGLTLYTMPVPPADTSGLMVQENGVLHPEDFRHEQYLLVEEQGKKILISGCSHKGILQIADHFRPDVLIGGFHFMKIGDSRILENAARELLQHPCVYFTGHCTGQMQFDVLKGIMGDRLNSLSSGISFSI